MKSNKSINSKFNRIINEIDKNNLLEFINDALLVSYSQQPHPWTDNDLCSTLGKILGKEEDGVLLYQFLADRMIEIPNDSIISADTYNKLHMLKNVYSGKIIDIENMFKDPYTIKGVALSSSNKNAKCNVVFTRNDISTFTIEMDLNSMFYVLAQITTGVIKKLEEAKPEYSESGASEYIESANQLIGIINKKNRKREKKSYVSGEVAATKHE